MRQKYAYAAWFALHFLLIVGFSLLATVQLVAKGPTIFSPHCKDLSKRAERILDCALGQDLPGSDPIRQAIGTYLNLAGIDAGYGYFAPNVPGGYRLVFELTYSDGRVEYDLPAVGSEAAGLRIAGLIDTIGRTPYDTLREILVKTLAQSIWRKHPHAQSIRAILGTVKLPTANEFKHGKRESCEFLYAYDFSLQN